MPKVIYTKPATLDLREIRNYIKKDNEPAARNLINAIREKCVTYSLRPYIGQESEEYGAGVRRFPHGNYVVFYRPIDDGIAIVHVFHGARNLPDAFRSEGQE